MSMGYLQESKQTVNQPNTTNNTRFGLRKTLTMNRDEVEEDPSKDEGRGGKKIRARRYPWIKSVMGTTRVAQQV